MEWRGSTLAGLVGNRRGRAATFWRGWVHSSLPLWRHPLRCEPTAPVLFMKPLDGLTRPVAIYRHASSHVEFNDMACIFSGAGPELGCRRSNPNPGNPHRLPGIFLRSSGSPRLPQKSGNTRLASASPADRQAGCFRSRPDRVSLVGQTRIAPGNRYANGITVTSGKAAAHPWRGRRLGVKTRCPSWDSLTRGEVSP